MSTNMNMLQLIQLARSQANPPQFVMAMLEQQSGNNPLFANLLTLAKANNTKEIEQITRNMFRERGLDFDSEFTKFKNMLGVK